MTDYEGMKDAAVILHASIYGVKHKANPTINDYLVYKDFSTKLSALMGSILRVEIRFSVPHDKRFTLP